MSVIVCAIRGGPASRATVAQALTLAQQTGLPLHFLYVVNTDFLSGTDRSDVRVPLEQLHQMGASVLLTVQALADSHGVTAQREVRYGKVEDEIAGLCRERGADYLVLGRPQGGDGKGVFTETSLTKFIERIEEQADAQVVLPNGIEKRNGGDS
jgi:nucleotide-binding universal stress UspA family protein